MQFALGTTILSGWNYPHPLFTHVPSREERAPFFLWARLVGFEGIDVADSWMAWYGMAEADLVDMRRQLDEIGLVCAAVNPYRCVLVRHPAAAENETKLRRSIDVAQIWGAGLINLALSIPFPGSWSDADRSWRQRGLARGGDYSDAEFTATADKLRELADYGAARGVALSIELHDDGMTDLSTHVMRLHDLIDHQNVGVNPDLQNGFRVPYPTEDWREALLTMAPRTNFWHVKSNTRRYLPDSGRYQTGRASLRDGDIDYRWALTQLRRASFDGWVSIESGGGDALHQAEADLLYLRGLVREWLPLVGLS